MRPLAICVALGVATLVAGGGQAAGQAPTATAIIAGDNFFKTINGANPNVTIAAGGHVDFSYPSGSSLHNVTFIGMKPSVCGVSRGPAGDESALPLSPSPPGWEGGCDFTAAGTYPFVCDLHSSMTGSVTVLDAGARPPAPPPPPPSVGEAASGLRVAAAQRGSAVRGSVRVRTAGSRLLARTFVRRDLLNGGRSRIGVAVGRQLRPAVGAARVSFRVALNAAARRALRRRGRLSISLRLTVTPPTGVIYTATRNVIVRPALPGR